MLGRRRARGTGNTEPGEQWNKEEATPSFAGREQVAELEDEVSGGRITTVFDSHNVQGDSN